MYPIFKCYKLENNHNNNKKTLTLLNTQLLTKESYIYELITMITNSLAIFLSYPHIFFTIIR